tara:strand:- start:402 stop:1805 length:1404 start_codon:yes stop_codon:yes gene_type:complete
MKKILIIEDEEVMAATLDEYLMHSMHDIHIVQNGTDGIKAIEQIKPDAVLLDLNLPDMHGFEILKLLHKNHKHCAVIVITGQASMSAAVDAMKLGAHDFVPKPVSPERLRVSLQNALERVELQEIAQNFEKMSRKNFQGFIGKSPKMQAVYSLIENAAQSKASVFITGESGTGKELAARAVHELSSRANKPFEVLNCAAIPHNLLESEIFGHVRGAFTGATADREGAASRADGGTLFLDELGEMPIDLQAKLLRFIQSGSFMPVGDSRQRDVDVRFICATNRDPMNAVREGLLREDLYYRLNVVPVYLPPLRDRGAEDIKLLAQHFLEEISREEKKEFTSFSEEVLELFVHYRWSGNVRELENTIRCIVVLNKGETIELEMMNVLDQEAERRLEMLATDAQGAQVFADQFLPVSELDIKPLEVYERDIILAALSACNGNITKASRRLDINPATIHRKQKQWKERGIS